MADPSNDEKQSWLESQEAVWAELHKRERRKRDLLWLLAALLLLFIGNLTGYPSLFFT